MMVKRDKLAIICLIIGMFFNPLGYDALFKMVLDLTGSYWTTVSIFYLIAALFVGLYFYFGRVNPILEIKKKIVKIYKKIKIVTHFFE